VPHVRFAYLKATEGSDWVDPQLGSNWNAARAAGLRVGAYHFFTFCTAPALQAQNFLKNVPQTADALPPVVDVEFGGNCRSVPPAAQVRADLAAFVSAVEIATGRKAILYETNEAYDAFLAGTGLGDRLWLRDVWKRPRNPAWLIWQFDGRARIDGVEGFVDLDVLAGTADLGSL